MREKTLNLLHLLNRLNKFRKLFDICRSMPITLRGFSMNDTIHFAISLTALLVMISGLICSAGFVVSRAHIATSFTPGFIMPLSRLVVACEANMDNVNLIVCVLHIKFNAINSF